MLRDNYAIHWFRRDLRVAGNSALRWSWKEFKGKVVGLFCFDREFLSRPDFSPDRFAFFLETLNALKLELQDMGSDLLFIGSEPRKAFPALFSQLNKRPHTVSFNRDYEPFARRRDRAMTELLQNEGIAIHTERDHLLVEPDELFRGNEVSAGYQVYTPFFKKWLELLKTDEIQSRIRLARKSLTHFEKGQSNAETFSLTWKELTKGSPIEDCLTAFCAENRKRVRVTIPNAGAREALRALKAFAPKLDCYAKDRDMPAEAGTSRMSLYLKNGSITVAQIIAALDLSNQSQSKYLSELAWREFYYHILYRFPSVEHSAFQKKFSSVKWRGKESWLQAWKDGMTGYPLVDAAMRELNTTGWMHNRARMVVASFLTKDLMINWQEGERYFMDRLLDGDLAPNNGGWQWAASTGCDPQPYFRIFNPVLQSQKFDPRGQYIRRYVPELSVCCDKEIHWPHAKPIRGYPKPIVDHAVQRTQAIEMMEEATSHLR